MNSRSILGAGSTFWNELCGTTTALRLGITDRSHASLELFDDWFFKIYPYLPCYIPFETLVGRDVLEVGLGYGSVSQRLAEAGTRFVGLDIASGPVEMVNYRLSLRELPGRVLQGSILEAPFEDASFDCVVAIGCYHHTGDVRRALDETWRILRAGGLAVVMVYHAYSYRRWLRWPRATLRYWRWDRSGEGASPRPDEAERRAYDANSSGEAAPETVFLSRRYLRRIARRYSQVRCWIENAGGERLLRPIPRPVLLATLGKVAGLDLYAHLVK